jgi:hypothetical protein
MAAVDSVHFNCTIFPIFAAMLMFSRWKVRITTQFSANPAAFICECTAACSRFYGEYPSFCKFFGKLTARCYLGNKKYQVLMEAYGRAVALGKNLGEMLKIDENGLWTLLVQMGQNPQQASWHLACAANRAAELAHKLGPQGQYKLFQDNLNAI